MKKSTKIILPALAVLVLGTAAAATGTVAWFASNGLVTAEGMEVKCSTSKNLIISNKNPNESSWGTSNYGTTVEAIHNKVEELSPASTTKTLIKTGSPTFYGVDKQVDAVSGAIVEGATVSTIAESTGYVKYSFWLAAQSLTDLNLKIKEIRVAEKDDPATTDVDESKNGMNAYISQALKFAVYYVDATRSETKTEDTVNSEIFNMGANGATQYLGLNGAGTVTKIDYEEGSAGVITDIKVGEEKTSIVEEVKPATADSINGYSLGQILSTKEATADVKSQTWSQIDFYFWYEGQDPKCTAANALSVQSLDISIDLEANTAD